jgi:hypothetical protein
MPALRHECPSRARSGRARGAFAGNPDGSIGIDYTLAVDRRGGRVAEDFPCLFVLSIPTIRGIQARKTGREHRFAKREGLAANHLRKGDKKAN